MGPSFFLGIVEKALFGRAARFFLALGLIFDSCIGVMERFALEGEEDG